MVFETAPSQALSLAGPGLGGGERVCLMKPYKHHAAVAAATAKDAQVHDRCEGRPGHGAQPLRATATSGLLRCRAVWCMLEKLNHKSSSRSPLGERAQRGEKVHRPPIMARPSLAICLFLNMCGGTPPWGGCIQQHSGRA